jgi:hypothetical protein
MAKQDSLQVGIDGIKATKVYAFETNDPANSSWALEIAKYGTEPGANQQMNSYEVTLGICRSTSGPISTGNFYVLVELNRK